MDTDSWGPNSISSVPGDVILGQKNSFSLPHLSVKWGVGIFLAARIVVKICSVFRKMLGTQSAAVLALL